MVLELTTTTLLAEAEIEPHPLDCRPRLTVAPLTKPVPVITIDVPPALGPELG